MKKNPAAVSLGKLGGLAGRGKCKARTSEQARKAALVRWQKNTANKIKKAVDMRKRLRYNGRHERDTRHEQDLPNGDGKKRKSN